jgi:hypothetical protein
MNNFTRWPLTQTVRWFVTLALLSMTNCIRAADFQISDLTVENGRISLTYRSSQSGMYRLLQGATVNDIGTPIATNIPAGELGVFSVSLPDFPAASFYRVELVADRVDTDRDGVPDVVELNLGLDPAKPSSRDDGVLDGERDLAGDSLSLTWKLKYGYDPLKLDSDDSGVPDAQEDPDRDGVTNVQEKLARTSPISADTDADGWDDKSEIADGTDPVNEQSGPRLEGWVTTFVSFLNEPSTSQLLNSQPPVLQRNGSLSNAASPIVVDPSFRITPLQDFRNSPRSGSSGVDGPLILPTPSQRQDQKSMVFDEARREMVLFGSYFANNRENPATWLWDGYDWSVQTNSMQPRLRNNYAFAYDMGRRQAVLFGGSIPGVGATNETWIWNGTNWMQATPAHSPSPRAFARMAFDAVRQQVILFGGIYQVQGYSDTWSWDGTDWTQLQPSNSAPATQGARGDVMASDSRQEILLLSSHRDSNVPKTWLWNGTDWKPVQSEANPVLSSAGGGLAYDTVNNVFVFFGGSNETWIWGGTNWINKFRVSAPGTRNGFAMAYDPIRRKVVLHSGFASYYPGRAETWLWDGTDWSFWSGTFQVFDMRPHANGVWNFTHIYIPSNVTVGFIKNSGNTPVTWLASSNVVINGMIDLNGGTRNGFEPIPENEAPGAPGGFAGGLGGQDYRQWGSFAGTPGRGPGGSAPGVSYGQPSERAKGPATYGNIYLQPLIGGSGGGGGGSPGPFLGTYYGRGGGGGGGAIFISSSTEITVNGSITAQGGSQSAIPNGSGGAIRLQADRITGIGSLNAEFDGRIRLESYDLAFRGTATPVPITSVPIPTRTFKPAGASLAVASVARKNVALPPSANPLAPDVTFNESGPISIQVQGTGLADGTPVSLRLAANEVIISASTNLSNGEATFSNIVVPKGPGIVQVSTVFPLIPD